MITGGVLIAVGLILFVVVMSLNQWDFRKLSTVQYETNTYELQTNFESISIHTDSAQVSFSVSDDETCKVVCYEGVKQKHTVTLENGVLTISVKDERAWYEKIGFSFESPFITVYLPQREYHSLTVRGSTGGVTVSNAFSFDSVDIAVSTGYIRNYASAQTANIQTTTGDIFIEGITVNALKLSASTGNVTVLDTICKVDFRVGVNTGDTRLSNVQCGAFWTTGNTGSVSLQNVIAEETLSVERRTGDVHLEQCDAADIYIQTNTGSVKGVLLSEKVFTAESITGSVEIPESTAGSGSCKIVTTTGSIKIVIGS